MSTPPSVVFATVALGNMEPSVDIASTSVDCPAYFATIETTHAIASMNVSIMQFARNATHWLLVTQPLLTDTSFVYFGWLVLYDWVVGLREVVSFQGVARVDLNLRVPAAVCIHGVSTTLGSTSRASLVVVACLVMASKSAVHGSNLFLIPSIVGSIWIGRSLVVVRGATAILVLRTTQLTSSRRGQLPTSIMVVYMRHTVAYVTVAMMGLAAVLLVYICLVHGVLEVMNVLEPAPSSGSVDRFWSSGLMFNGFTSSFEATHDPSYNRGQRSHVDRGYRQQHCDGTYARIHSVYYVTVNSILVWLVTVALGVASPIAHV
ncbi:Aste57867_25079 [Aphanomyces stellatus]|uniref:Aste57867_25079 protein n=1 Tax=Aphanomyces stellatus TaxID=120398 RepID=A0A485LWM3_9STRA|nr:hypothetical protein As57867_025001 [Aphanomyces stellatus]VFU01710.1 Aste57867_25079 [Aphanomyces stellatus]